MKSKEFSLTAQKKNDKFVHEIVLEKSKIIFGPQHTGIEPIFHCSVILEGGLKIYLKKIDPQQNISRWGLGKLFGRSLEKDTFPKRFRTPIGKLNKIWVDKKHNGEKGEGISVDEIRILTSDFIKWFFDKVIKEKLPDELLEIIDNKRKKKPIVAVTKENTKISNNKKDSSTDRKHILEKAYNKLKVEIKPESKPKVDKLKLDRFCLNLKSDKNFSRTYYADIVFTVNEIRGISTSIPHSILSGLNIKFSFLESGIAIVNTSENLNIKIDNISLYKKRKKIIDKPNFILSINDITLNCSLINY